MADMMVDLIETFNPVHLQPVPLDGLCTRACNNLLTIYRYARRLTEAWQMLKTLLVERV